jgi:broad specificity phosphatase PhoE
MTAGLAKDARRLLLVRHGLPDYRGGKASDIFPGPLLSDIGRAQAAQTADVLAEFHPWQVHTSPLMRAWQTAEVIGQRLGIAVRVDGELREWHRTERLYEVSVRLARWLVGWLRGDEPCAVVVSHASPLLAILRSALYIPHLPWFKTGAPDALEVSGADRFEVTMGSVFELLFEPDAVTARCVFHPAPRVCYTQYGLFWPRPRRPVPGAAESRLLRRANWLAIIGGRSSVPPVGQTTRLPVPASLPTGDGTQCARP